MSGFNATPKSEIRLDYATHEDFANDTMDAVSSGNLDASVWAGPAIRRMCEFNPELLAIDSLNGRIAEYIESTGGDFTIVDDYTLSYIWSLLPARPSQLSPTGSVLLLAGDMYYTSGIKKLGDRKVPFNFSLGFGAFIASSVGLAAYANSMHDNNPQKKLSRRQFLCGLGAALATGPATGGLAFAAELLAYQKDTSISDIADATLRALPTEGPLITPIGGAVNVVLGRSALMTAKTLEASDATDLRRSAVFMGNGHRFDERDVMTESRRAKAIRACADTFLAHGDSPADRNVAIHRIKVDMAKTALIEVSEIPTDSGAASVSEALHTAIRPRSVYLSPTILEILEDWPDKR